MGANNKCWGVCRWYWMTSAMKGGQKIIFLVIKLANEQNCIKISFTVVEFIILTINMDT
jgi:hypothetical protein